MSWASLLPLALCFLSVGRSRRTSKIAAAGSPACSRPLASAACFRAAASSECVVVLLARGRREQLASLLFALFLFRSVLFCFFSFFPRLLVA